MSVKLGRAGRQALERRPGRELKRSSKPTKGKRCTEGVKGCGKGDAGRPDSRGCGLKCRRVGRTRFKRARGRPNTHLRPGDSRGQRVCDASSQRIFILRVLSLKALVVVGIARSSRTRCAGHVAWLAKERQVGWRRCVCRVLANVERVELGSLRDRNRPRFVVTLRSFTLGMITCSGSGCTERDRRTLTC